jgi:hypothetical protein
MNPVAKTLIVMGALLVVAGVLWQIGGKVFPFGRLPGDIAVEKEHFKFYFPIVSCIIVSIVLSLLMALWRFFK